LLPTMHPYGVSGHQQYSANTVGYQFSGYGYLVFVEDHIPPPRGALSVENIR